MTSNKLIGLALLERDVSLAEIQPLTVETNTFKRTSLADMKIHCRRCDKQYKYCDRIEHQTTTCDWVRLSCPAKCGARLAINDLRAHMHESCPLIETKERPEKDARIKMITDGDFSAQLLKGLEDKVKENMSEAALKTYRRLGKIDFPKAAPDHLNFETPFSKWTKVSVDGDITFNQGEVSQEGVRNGQNVVIEKGDYVLLGNWKDGKRHGNFL